TPAACDRCLYRKPVARVDFQLHLGTQLFRRPCPADPLPQWYRRRQMPRELWRWCRVRLFFSEMHQPTLPRKTTTTTPISISYWLPAKPDSCDVSRVSVRHRAAELFPPTPRASGFRDAILRGRAQVRRLHGTSGILSPRPRVPCAETDKTSPHIRVLCFCEL